MMVNFILSAGWLSFGIVCKYQTSTFWEAISAYGIELCCFIFAAGTDIQTDEKVGIKLVCKLAVHSNPPD